MVCQCVLHEHEGSSDNLARELAHARRQQRRQRPVCNGVYFRKALPVHTQKKKKKIHSGTTEPFPRLPTTIKSFAPVVRKFEGAKANVKSLERRRRHLVLLRRSVARVIAMQPTQMALAVLLALSHGFSLLSRFLSPRFYTQSASRV